MSDRDARLIHHRVLHGRGLSEEHRFLEQEENSKEQEASNGKHDPEKQVV